MKIIITFMIIASMNFTIMMHPLSMGLILLVQTIMSCLICSFYLSSYLLSYILYLIFVGGMLILFMYMSSIASNEKFVFSMKLMLMNISFLLINYLSINLKMSSIYKYFNMNNNYDEYILSKMYIIPSGMMTLILTVYLLFVLIIVINILMINMSPLRSMI